MVSLDIVGDEMEFNFNTYWEQTFKLVGICFLLFAYDCYMSVPKWFWFTILSILLSVLFYALIPSITMEKNKK